MARRIVITAALLLMSLPLQAEEIPVTLPKEFLAQLPLLMSLSNQEFDGLLATLQQENKRSEPTKNTGEEEKDDEN